MQVINLFGEVVDLKPQPVVAEEDIDLDDEELEDDDLDDEEEERYEKLGARAGTVSWNVTCPYCGSYVDCASEMEGDDPFADCDYGDDPDTCPSVECDDCHKEFYLTGYN